RRQAQYVALRERACVTKDGQPVELMINAGLAIDLPHIDDTGSAGIGLFRTELQFMVGQIRALLRAGGGRALRVMFPMISEVAEFDSAKALVERELTYLR